MTFYLYNLISPPGNFSVGVKFTECSSVTYTTWKLFRNYDFGQGTFQNGTTMVLSGDHLYWRNQDVRLSLYQYNNSIEFNVTSHFAMAMFTAMCAESNGTYPATNTFVIPLSWSGGGNSASGRLELIVKHEKATVQNLLVTPITTGSTYYRFRLRFSTQTQNTHCITIHAYSNNVIQYPILWDALNNNTSVYDLEFKKNATDYTTDLTESFFVQVKSFQLTIVYKALRDGL